MRAFAAAVLTFVVVLLWPGRRGGVPQVAQVPGLLVPGVRPVRTPGLEDDSHQGDGWLGPAGGPPFTGWRRWSRHPGADPPDLDVLRVLDAMAPALRAGLTPAAALRLLVEEAPAVEAGVPWSGVPGGSERSGHAGLRQPLVAQLVAAGDAGLPLSPVWARAARSGSGFRTGGRVGCGAVWRVRAGPRTRGGPVAEVALVASAWALSERLGAPVADAVTLAAAQVRESRLRRQRISVALAGPRATVTVLTLLPLAGPLLALLVGVAPGALYGSTATQVSVAVGVLLMLGGRWWCARMVEAAHRPVPVGSARAAERGR